MTAGHGRLGSLPSPGKGQGMSPKILVIDVIRIRRSRSIAPGGSLPEDQVPLFAIR